MIIKRLVMLVVVPVASAASGSKFKNISFMTKE